MDERRTDMLRYVTSGLLFLALGATAGADVSLVGETYCRGGVSSTGEAAAMQVLSEWHHAPRPMQLYMDDSLILTAYPLPATAGGLVVSGPGATQLPMGGGTLCIQTPYRMGYGVTADNGWFQVGLDLTDPDLAFVPLAAGPWHFQVLFRDPIAGELNLSDAVRVVLIEP